VSTKSALSLKELEQEIGVGRHTARRLAEQIGAVHVGRRILIPRARLEAFLEREASAVTAEGAA